MPEPLATEEDLPKAHLDIGAWLAARNGGVCARDGEMIRAITDIARTENECDLIAGYSPEAKAVEARWHCLGAGGKGLEEPVYARTVESACLLACGRYVRLRMVREAKTTTKRLV